MGWTRSGIYAEDVCEMLDHLDALYGGLEELATVSLNEDLTRQPLSREAAEAVLAFGDSLREGCEEARRFDNEWHESIEEALGLPHLTLAGIRLGHLEVESADIELAENGGESDG